MCCCNAAELGGILPIARPFEVKRSFLASSTVMHSPVIQQYNITLNVWSTFINAIDIWLITQCFEICSNFMKDWPCFPCSLLSTINKGWHLVTAAKGMEEKKCTGLGRSQISSDFINWYVSHSFTDSKCYLQGEYVQFMHNRYCNDNNISIYGSDHYLTHTSLYCILNV